MAPVHFALSQSEKLDSIFCSTAQHRQMMDQTLGVFGITPDIDLNLMRPGQTLPGLTAAVIEGVTTALQKIKPAAVLVQGDTTTVLGTALAAFYESVPIGHVEAETCRLVGTDPERILSESDKLLSDPEEYARRSGLRNPYGDGKAAQRIRNRLEQAIG